MRQRSHIAAACVELPASALSADSQLIRKQLAGAAACHTRESSQQPKPIGVASMEIPAAKPVGVLTVATAEPVGVPLAVTAKPVGELFTAKAQACRRGFY